MELAVEIAIEALKVAAAIGGALLFAVVLIMGGWLAQEREDERRR